MTKHENAQAVAAVGSPLEPPVRRVDLDAIRFLASGQDDVKSMALRECAAEIWMLRRWKSTNAPRLEALRGLLDAAQIEAEKGREARATLESERAANALLTDELERLRAGPWIGKCQACGHEHEAPNVGAKLETTAAPK